MTASLVPGDSEFSEFRNSTSLYPVQHLAWREATYVDGVIHRGRGHGEFPRRLPTRRNLSHGRRGMHGIRRSLNLERKPTNGVPLILD